MPDGGSQRGAWGTRLHGTIRMLGATLGALALGSCDGTTTEPEDGSRRLAIGEVVNGAIAEGDSARVYRFPAAAGRGYVVFALAFDGVLRLDVQDSLRERILASALVGTNGLPLDESIALRFTATVTSTHTLVLTGYPEGTGVQYRLFIYGVDDAPEQRPVTFAIGDTVSGETIDPFIDVDVFSAPVAAGQLFAVVAEGTGGTDMGSLAVSVMNTQQTIGFGLFPAGVPAARTSGRIQPDAAGTYEFRFEAFNVGTPGTRRFSGPYRFWTYAIDPAPERRGAAVPFSTEIAGESLGRAGDVDEFTFSAAAGAELNVFFQGSETSRLAIGPATGPALAIIPGGADTALFARSTGRVLLPASGGYVVRVSGESALLADTGAYRFYLYPVDRRPERMPAAIVPGDTIAGEDLELPGDVDEFTFTAEAGQEFNAFLQASGVMRLEAVDGNGTVLAVVESRGTDLTLLGQATPRIVIQTGGTYRLRVAGAEPDSRGPYRLFLARTDRRPESGSGTLVFGDSVFSERLDLPGDVDEFHVVVPDPSGANLVVALSDSAPPGHLLVAEIVDSASGQVVGTTSSYGWPGQTGALALPRGSYIVRVQESSFDYRPALRGGYRLWLYRFSFAPESVRDTIAPGDTVSGEVLDVPGDVDQYYFYGRQRQHVNVMIQGQVSSGGASGGFMAFVSSPTGGPFAVVATPLSSAALSDHQTLRMDLPEEGWYGIRVLGGSSPTLLTEQGPYRLAIGIPDTLPETVSGTLAIGDSLTAEGLDFPGDWDQFVVTAPAGQELNVLFGTGLECCRFPRVLVLDPETGDSLAGNVGQLTRIAGPAQVPAGGRVVVAVSEFPSVSFRQCYDATCGGLYAVTGLYRVQVLALDRAPETAPATVALNDTVSTEAILPAGDMDEFMLTSAPGDTLRLWFRLRAAPVPAGSVIRFRVIDPGTGAVLAGSGFGLTGSNPTFSSPGAFVVPASGQVLIRFGGTGTFGDEIGTAPYEFYVTRGP